MFPEIHLWCNTCQPLGGKHGSWSLPKWMFQQRQDAGFDRETVYLLYWLFTWEIELWPWPVAPYKFQSILEMIRNTKNKRKFLTLPIQGKILSFSCETMTYRPGDKSSSSKERCRYCSGSRCLTPTRCPFEGSVRLKFTSSSSLSTSEEHSTSYKFSRIHFK